MDSRQGKEIHFSLSEQQFGSAGAGAPNLLALGNISENFCLIIPAHEQISANSLELNAVTSLSDDSGIPLTNSSISSGDSSYKMGICKFEMEIVESDGEVSQFDSLDNCSEGGMSAENFNTLKKGPIAPIDPPPEFQDSPHTTLVRAKALHLKNNSITKSQHLITRWSSQSSLHQQLTTKENGHVDQQQLQLQPQILLQQPEQLFSFENYDTTTTVTTLLRPYISGGYKDSYNKHIYSSDSILNRLCVGGVAGDNDSDDNIYDEPHDILSSSVGNSIDIVETTRVPAIVKTLCPHFADHTRYFKAIQSDEDTKQQRLNVTGVSEIHDYDLYYGLKRNHQCDTIQRKLLYSPLHNYHQRHHHHPNSANRPNSRNSLNSRLSSSHNSLSVSNANKADDSIFITQAMSHDALLNCVEICDFYNVPIDSDIYAFPVDMIKSDQEQDNAKDYTYKPPVKNSHSQKNRKNKRRKRSSNSNNNSNNVLNNNNININYNTDENNSEIDKIFSNSLFNKNYHRLQRSSVGGNRENVTFVEPLHMTLDEVKQFYHTIYSDSSIKTIEELPNNNYNNQKSIKAASSNQNESKYRPSNKEPYTQQQRKLMSQTQTNSMSIINQNKNNNQKSMVVSKIQNSEKKSQFTLNIMQKFCSLFRFRTKNASNRNRINSTDSAEYLPQQQGNHKTTSNAEDKRKKFQSRALPPLPNKSKNEADAIEEEKENKSNESRSLQFTSSIEKVKDYGWYWGPLSSESAERVLSNEPDGSFIVRDSSDDHYIFSLSFKLNNCVRHVRIEQDQGTFSFGSYAKFKSQTITEFIEKAVDHSRSGRYLFFLHRRPEHGPMRVQLTNPVSRFKHIQSLQHMCRFVILKAVVRKDLIETLPLPRRLLDYLNYKHFYSEQIESDSSQSQMSGDGTV